MDFVPARATDHRKSIDQQTARASGNTKGPAVLGEQLSASLREALVGQISEIKTGDEAATWAHRNLAAKNELRPADAQIVEEEFKQRLSAISALGSTSAGPADSDLTPAQSLHAVSERSRADASSDAGTRQKASIRGRNRSHNNTIHSLRKTVRLRDKEHRRYVTRQPCLVCGRVPSDSHHLKFAQPRALGRRVSDEYTVPVCRLHHRELHRSGDELAWWETLNIDPVPVALRLWQETRADGVVPTSS
jgi:hypothetical protein